MLDATSPNASLPPSPGLKFSPTTAYSTPYPTATEPSTATPRR